MGLPALIKAYSVCLMFQLELSGHAFLNVMVR